MKIYIYISMYLYVFIYVCENLLKYVFNHRCISVDPSLFKDIFHEIGYKILMYIYVYVDLSIYTVILHVPLYGTLHIIPYRQFP